MSKSVEGGEVLQRRSCHTPSNPSPPTGENKFSSAQIRGCSKRVRHCAPPTWGHTPFEPVYPSNLR